MNLRHERADDPEKYHNGKLLSLFMKMNLAIALNLRSALFVTKIVTHKIKIFTQDILVFTHDKDFKKYYICITSKTVLQTDQKEEENV